MKTLWNFILLMGILCLAGCSSDDPQSVSFSIKEYKASVIGEILTVNVTANCPWTLSENSQQIEIEEMAGEGNASIRVNIARNFNYDDLTHVITITSEDRTSSDVLTIVQDKNIGTEVGEFGMISEEGGTFEIPVKTNDEITSVDTPDWMTYTSSRGLTGYTYAFTVEQNKTGSVRSGVVKLNGKENITRLEVTQDSYAPEKFYTDMASIIAGHTAEADFSVTPSYSDRSKLEILAEGASVTLQGKKLKVEADEFGPVTLTVKSDGKTIHEQKMEFFPKNPLQDYGEVECYLGQKRYINFHYYSPDYTVRSFPEEFVRIVDGRWTEAVGYGVSAVSVSHPKSVIHGSFNIRVVPFLLEARIAWLGQKSDGSFDVQFTARIEGPASMRYDGFVLTDKNGYIMSLNNGTVKNLTEGKSNRIQVITTNAINVGWDGYPNVEESLMGAKIMVQVSIDGNVHKRSVPIDVKRVGYY